MSKHNAHEDRCRELRRALEALQVPDRPGFQFFPAPFGGVRPFLGRQDYRGAPSRVGTRGELIAHLEQQLRDEGCDDGTHRQ